MEVVYSTAIKELPDSFEVFFPNSSTGRIVKMPADSMSIVSDNTVRAYFRPNFQQGITGFSSGMAGQGTHLSPMAVRYASPISRFMMRQDRFLPARLLFTNVRDREMILL
jgi:hypothetical protein